MIQLLGIAGSLAKTFLEGKVEKEKAKAEVMKTAAQHDSTVPVALASEIYRASHRRFPSLAGTMPKISCSQAGTIPPDIKPTQRRRVSPTALLPNLLQ